ncbi:MAG: hypothetical protein KJZ87_07435 [Thermoguttaceae bacterium]|nr:hypothetical protein [Thermoguttaceae bacterium]
MIRIVIGSLVSVMLLANGVWADTIRADFLNTYGSKVKITASNVPDRTDFKTYVGPYEFKLSDPDPSNTLNDATKLITLQEKNASKTTLTFCFDLYDFTDGWGYNNSDPVYTIQSMIGAPIGEVIQVDSKKAQMLGHLWNYAYYYDPDNDVNTVDSALQWAKTIAGHALSLAIWETMYEYTTIPSVPIWDISSIDGDKGFKVVSWEEDWGTNNANDIKVLANQWLVSAYSAPDGDISFLRALTNSSYQDQSVLIGIPTRRNEPVPEPTLAIQLLGLCVAGALPLRYWRRGRKGAA